MLTKSEINFFNEHGYIKLKNEAILKFTNNLQKEISTIIHKIFKNKPTLNLDKISLEEQITLLWDEDKQKNNYLKKLYEILPSTIEVISTCQNESFFSISQSLGINHPEPSTLPTVRIDRPFDKKYSTGIHQDYWYSFQSETSITFWLPLININPKMGFLSVIPKSHKLGLVDFYDDGKYVFKPKSNFHDSDFLDIQIELGECLVFSQFLIHKSGENISNKPRMTLQLRFHDLLNHSIDTSFTCTLSEFVKAKQKKILEQS